MSTTTSSTDTPSASSSDLLVSHAPSDRQVSLTMQQGLEKIVVQTIAGGIVGGLAGLVLVRNSAAARRSMTGLGAGIGLGAAWTRTNMNLEALLENAPSRKKA